MQTLVLAFLALTLSGAHSALAPFIKPCKSSDYQCTKESAEAAIPYFTPGIPELGVPPTVPLILKEVNADKGDLKLSFTDVKVEGLNKCKIASLTRDEKNSIITVILECPIQGSGLYKMNGKLFIIPTQGDGKFEIKTDEIQIVAVVKYKTITGKDGAKHWKITSYEYSYDLVKKVHFHIENLFGGDETKAKPVMELFDNNWKEIITEFGGPIIKALVKGVVENVKKFFLAVPTSELEL